LRLAEWYRAQGFRAVIECERNGKACDIGLQAPDGKSTALEVAISPNNEARNALANLESGWDAVLIACKNARVKKAVEEKLGAVLGEDQKRRVTVTLLAEASFLKDLRSKARAATASLQD
jgi:hypothetical protein